MRHFSPPSMIIPKQEALMPMAFAAKLKDNFLFRSFLGSSDHNSKNFNNKTEDECTQPMDLLGSSGRAGFPYCFPLLPSFYDNAVFP